MKREAPSERDLTDTIATAFERLPEPDSRRLAVIEEQLLAQTKSRGRSKFVWWWLVGALVAGGATAMWWAVNYDSDKQQVAPVVAPPVSNPPAQPDRPEGAETAPAGQPAQKKEPVIYRKEQ